MPDGIKDRVETQMLRGAVINGITEGGNRITAQELEALKFGIRTGRIPVREVALGRSNFDELLAYLQTSDGATARDELAISEVERRQLVDAVLQLKPIVEAAMRAPAAMRQFESLQAQHQLDHLGQMLDIMRTSPRQPPADPWRAHLEAAAAGLTGSLIGQIGRVMEEQRRTGREP